MNAPAPPRDDARPSGGWTAIGLIRSPHPTPEGAPIQASAAHGARGTIEIFEPYVAGLADLDGFSHLILIYHFHLGRREELTVMPFLDSRRRGVFATRSPARPNRIGLSIVRLLHVDGARIEIADVDVVDGTPLIDIKPYVPAFDERTATSIGWFAGRVDAAPATRADGRFGDTPDDRAR
ncbi:MAG: tRNA (N6-threonylcarbamoyladenosine(37)-N6)-methyltransferase TrmO [Burkholderiaceae bacterium]